MSQVLKNDPWYGGFSQVDDFGFLMGMVKMLRPVTIVQIGVFAADGSKALLSASDPDARLFDFDPAPPGGARGAPSTLQHQLGSDKYTFYMKGGEKITLDDLHGQYANFVFFDAGHEVESNKKIWQALMKCTSEDVTIAIHDTGFWSIPFMENYTKQAKTWLCLQRRPIYQYGTGNKHNGTHYMGLFQQEERRFVNWILDTYPEFVAVHFHSFRFMRNGITIIQRQVNKRLVVEGGRPVMACKEW